jgi:hypothetical protein
MPSAYLPGLMSGTHRARPIRFAGVERRAPCFVVFCLRGDFFIFFAMCAPASRRAVQSLAAECRSS